MVIHAAKVYKGQKTQVEVLYCKCSPYRVSSYKDMTEIKKKKKRGFAAMPTQNAIFEFPRRTIFFLGPVYTSAFLF